MRKVLSRASGHYTSKEEGPTQSSPTKPSPALNHLHISTQFTSTISTPPNHSTDLKSPVLTLCKETRPLQLCNLSNSPTLQPSSPPDSLDSSQFRRHGTHIFQSSRRVGHRLHDRHSYHSPLAIKTYASSSPWTSWRVPLRAYPCDTQEQYRRNLCKVVKGIQ